MGRQESPHFSLPLEERRCLYSTLPPRIERGLQLMLKWLRNKLYRHKSISQTRGTDEHTLPPAPVGTEAQLVVVYNILEGSGFTQLRCEVHTETRFLNEEIATELSQVTNIAARMLTDAHNIELIYISLMNNLTHVPTKLREKPN